MTSEGPQTRARQSTRARGRTTAIFRCPPPLLSSPSLLFMPISPAPVSVGNRESPVPSEGPGGYLDARRRLSPLVLARVDHPDDPLYRLCVTMGDDLVKALFFFYIGLEDRVEDIVGRQGVGVFLVGLQF